MFNISVSCVQGKPILIIQLGQLKIKELLEIASAETLIRFMLKEVEHTWRNKFSDCQELVYKGGVEQLIIIVDLKGAKLKDLSNKHVSYRYPSFFTQCKKCHDGLGVLSLHKKQERIRDFYLFFYWYWWIYNDSVDKCDIESHSDWMLEVLPWDAAQMLRGKHPHVLWGALRCWN